MMNIIIGGPQGSGKVTTTAAVSLFLNEMGIPTLIDNGADQPLRDYESIRLNGLTDAQVKNLNMYIAQAATRKLDWVDRIYNLLRRIFPEKSAL